MIDNSSIAPISPSVSYPRVWASDLGGSGGSIRIVVQDWVERCDKLFAGELEGETFDAEDVQPQQTLTTPELPSRAVIEEHRIDHWPYRSWCEENVWRGSVENEATNRVRRRYR